MTGDCTVFNSGVDQNEADANNAIENIRSFTEALDGRPAGVRIIGQDHPRHEIVAALTL